ERAVDQHADLALRGQVDREAVHVWPVLRCPPRPPPPRSAARRRRRWHRPPPRPPPPGPAVPRARAPPHPALSPSAGERESRPGAGAGTAAEERRTTSTTVRMA